MTKERDLLSRALEDWDFSDKVETLDPIFEEIRTYLSAEPEAEPVSQRKVFICANCDCVYSDDPVSECDCAIGANVFSEAWIVTRPEPARKPITHEQVEEELEIHKYRDMPEYVNGFLSGVDFAEKHHGIGEA